MMNIKLTNKLMAAWLLGAGLIISGCGRDVNTQKMADVDMAQFKTYAWLPAGDTTMTSFSADPTVTESIRNKVNMEMQQAGYTLDPENPDLLVLVRTKYDDKVELETYPASYAYFGGTGFYTGPWYDNYYPYYNTIGHVGGTNVRAVEYTKGTVVIDLIATERNEIVWRGSASESVYQEDKITNEIVENIDEIFEEFPS